MLLALNCKYPFLKRETQIFRFLNIEIFHYLQKAMQPLILCRLLIDIHIF